MPDRTPQRNPHATVLDFSLLLTAHHSRPPRLLPGVSTGEVLATIERLADRSLSRNLTYE
jgi:hypothetical protein